MSFAICSPALSNLILPIALKSLPSASPSKILETKSLLEAETLESFLM